MWVLAGQSVHLRSALVPVLNEFRAQAEGGLKYGINFLGLLRGI